MLGVLSLIFFIPSLVLVVVLMIFLRSFWKFQDKYAEELKNINSRLDSLSKSLEKNNDIEDINRSINEINRSIKSKSLEDSFRGKRV